MVASVAPGLTQFEFRLRSLDCSREASDCCGRVATLTSPSTGNIRSSLNGKYDHGMAAVDPWKREASDCSGRVASLDLTQSTMAASMPTRLSASSPRLRTLNESP